MVLSRFADWEYIKFCVPLQCIIGRCTLDVRMKHNSMYKSLGKHGGTFCIWHLHLMIMLLLWQLCLGTKTKASSSHTRTVPEPAHSLVHQRHRSQINFFDCNTWLMCTCTPQLLAHLWWSKGSELGAFLDKSPHQLPQATRTCCNTPCE